MDADHPTKGVNIPRRITTDEAPAAPQYLSRRDVQRHLRISEKGADRFIRAHGLRCGAGRQVLVRLDAYAACLFGLRRRSTRDDAPVPSASSAHRFFPPIEFAPGLDVCVVLCFEQKAGAPPDRRMHVLLQERGRAPPSTPEAMDRMTRSTDDYIRDEWAHALLCRILDAAEVRQALAGAPSVPLVTGAVPHLRTCLNWYQSTHGQITGAGLKRLLRRARGTQRDALFEALAQEVGNAPDGGACTARGYALHPLLDEAALARRIHRESPTLKRWRVDGTGPVFIRAGRLIRYSVIDVEAWSKSGNSW